MPSLLLGMPSARTVQRSCSRPLVKSPRGEVWSSCASSAMATTMIVMKMVMMMVMICFSQSRVVNSKHALVATQRAGDSCTD